MKKSKQAPMMHIPNVAEASSRRLHPFGIWNLFGFWILSFGFSAPRRGRRRGTGLIEVIVAAAIVTIIVAGVMSMYRLVIRSSREVIRGTQSSLLAEEGLEAVRVLRDAAWENLDAASIGTSYTLAWTGTTWALTETPSLIDGVFDRRVVFGNVYRNAEDDIADSGTLDEGALRVDVTVAWSTGSATTSRSVSTYMGNLFE